MGSAETYRTGGGIWGRQGPSWGLSAELPGVIWVPGDEGRGTEKWWGRGKRSRSVGEGEAIREIRGWGSGGRTDGEGHGRGTLGPVPPSEPGRPAGRLGTRPLPGPSSARPAGRPQDPFEAAVLGTRRAAPRPGGLHGCGAITQARVWAQSGRGGGLAGKARAAALACAVRVGPGLVLHRGPPRRPPLGVWG